MVSITQFWKFGPKSPNTSVRNVSDELVIELCVYAHFVHITRGYNYSSRSLAFRRVARGPPSPPPPPNAKKEGGEEREREREREGERGGGERIRPPQKKKKKKKKKKNPGYALVSFLVHPDLRPSEWPIVSVGSPHEYPMMGVLFITSCRSQKPSFSLSSASSLQIAWVGAMRSYRLGVLSSGHGL